MKFATTALALSLLTADAFMVQEHKNVMQPLNAESLIKHLSTSGDSPFTTLSPAAPATPAARTAPPRKKSPVVVKDTANSPFSPPKPSFSGVPQARAATQSNNSPVNGAVVKDTANSPFTSPKPGNSPFSPGARAAPAAPQSNNFPAKGAGTVVKDTANSPFTSFKSGNSPFSPGGPAAPAAPAVRTAPVNGPVVRDTANSPFTSPPKSGNSPFSPGARAAPAAQMNSQSNSYPVSGATTVVKDTANSPFTSPEYDSSTIKTMAVKSTKSLLEQVVPVEVQGGSLKTCSLPGSADRVTVLLTTRGRPLNANVELWQGPQNAPQQMAIYLEDGQDRPFRATIESPGSSNAISIRNTGQMELPLTAGIECEEPESTSPSAILVSNSKVRTIQGGAVYTTPFPPSVQSVQIALRTDGRPLQARVELLQGPNNNKQVMEVYTEDGDRRPFYVIVDTPGSGNVVRIVNTATVEFPLTAVAEAYMVEQADGIESSNLTWS